MCGLTDNDIPELAVCIDHAARAVKELFTKSTRVASSRKPPMITRIRFTVSSLRTTSMEFCSPIRPSDGTHSQGLGRKFSGKGASRSVRQPACFRHDNVSKSVSRCCEPRSS
ncbi:unnamed protein product, partial [Ectocarpus sp. 12 AP-2014]